MVFNLPPPMEIFYFGFSPLPMKLHSTNPWTRASEGYAVYTTYGIRELRYPIKNAYI